MRVRITLMILTLAGLCVSAQANDTVFASGFDPVWVSGYHVGYQSSLYPTASIDYTAMSHVIIGRVVPKNDGTLDTSFDIDATNGPIWAKGVAQAAHLANRKTILMVGGAGALGWTSAASSTYRAAFVSNLLAEIGAIGCDGLDLDWEPFGPSNYADFTSLAQALRAARPNVILTMPVGWINSNSATPDPFYGSISSLIDQVNIMSYDMEWPADGWDSWFTSALHGESGTMPSSIDSSVDFYLAAGVPRSRLGMGIGFYGVCWHGVTGPRQSIGSGAGITGSDNTFSYHNIVLQYYSASNYHFDTTSDMPWLGSAIAFGPNHCNFLSYENPMSVAVKGAYSLHNGLGGTIIWTIAQGYVPEQAGQENTLLEAVSAAFHPTH